MTPVHGRPGLTRVCLAQRARMLDELRARGIKVEQVVVGDDENLKTAWSLGFLALVRPNVLGRKINDGIEWACRAGAADFVAYCGSDDWYLADYFANLPAPDRIRTGSWRAVVEETGDRLIARHWPGRRGIAPWIIPRALLEPCGYRPADEDAMSGIDNSMARNLLGPWPRGPLKYPERARLRAARGARQAELYEMGDVDELQRVGFKGGGEQITPWRRALRRGATIDSAEPFATLATRYPADICERMERFYAGRRT